MSKSESWKSWTAIILILLVFGFIAAAWPYLTGFGSGGSSSIPVEPETIVIIIPPIPSVFDGTVINLGSFQAFAIVALVVIVSVMVVGVVIGVINYLISRLVTNTVSSDKYQERNASLQQHEKEKLAKKQEGRDAIKSQQNDYSRWAVIATSMAILMFAVFLGYLAAGTLFPNREIIEQGEIVNITAVFIIAFVLIALFILLLRMNPERLATVDETDYSGIPWETITVILLGVLILGLGIGIVVFLNSPL